MLLASSACSDAPKPVTVGENTSTTSASGDATGALGLAVISPQAADPKPTREFTALVGSDISLSLQVTGVDLANASVGYKSALAGITVTSSNLNIRAPAIGDYKITLFLRDMAQCKKEGIAANLCDLRGKVFRGEKYGFDVEHPIVISVIDPRSLGGDPTKNCVGGNGMFDDIMCNRGLIGGLVNMMMPGGIGGMIGGGATGGANTTQQQAYPTQQQGYYPTQQVMPPAY